MLEPFRQSFVRLGIETTVQIDANRERFFSTVTGKMYEKEHTAIIAYEENNEAGQVNNVVKISGNRAAMIRRGAVATRQSFIVGVETDSVYQTPYGALRATTVTKDLYFHWDQTRKSGVFVVRYDLRLQGNPPGSYTLKMVMEGE